MMTTHWKDPDPRRRGQGKTMAKNHRPRAGREIQRGKVVEEMIERHPRVGKAENLNRNHRITGHLKESPQKVL